MKYKTYQGGLDSFKERFRRLRVSKSYPELYNYIAEMQRLRKAIRELLRLHFKPTINKPWSKKV